MLFQELTDYVITCAVAEVLANVEYKNKAVYCTRFSCGFLKVLQLSAVAANEVYTDAWILQVH